MSKTSNGQTTRVVVTVGYVAAMWWILTPEWRRAPLLWMAAARGCQHAALGLGRLGLAAERRYYRCVR